jgi:hypothetical protein
MHDNDRPRPIWEEYEDYEEQFVPKGGTGGKKDRPPHSLTSQSARETAREQAQANREEEARNRILNVLRHFPKPDTDPNEYELLESYKNWLMDALSDESLLLQPSDIESAFMRAKTKAGGQNVNKVNSAVRLTHRPTRIFVRSDQSRDQNQNREIAESLLSERLSTHVADWKIIIENEGKLDPSHVRYFYIASHSPV